LHGEALAAGIGLIRSDLLTHLCQYPICADLFPNADHSVNGQPAILESASEKEGARGARTCEMHADPSRAPTRPNPLIRRR